MKNVVTRWLAGLASPNRPDEYESKELLRAFGIRTPRGVRIKTGQAWEPPGFAGPYVAKVCSAEILHKTERKGVIQGLDNDALSGALETLRTRFPGASVLIEEQVRFQGVELIVGATVDPTFGPAIMAGAGGILTELYQDVSFRLVPCSVSEARRMLEDLRVSPVFAGYRGLEMDGDDLAGLIARVSMLVEALGEAFGQLDINPLVQADGCWMVLDAKMVLEDPTVGQK